MSKNDQTSNPAGSNPSGVDLLGQPGSSTDQNPDEESDRTQATAIFLATYLANRGTGRKK